MNPEAALHFRDELRAARNAALRDAEAFDAIVFVVERLGVFLTGRIDGLVGYAGAIARAAERSPLAVEIATQHPGWHCSFARTYDLVRRARNDALHEGAYARHLTVQAVELTIVLEDALMADADTAREFMVSDPVCATDWQPISAVRRSMLANSFSWLPIAIEQGGGRSWHLLSDFSIARLLRSAETPAQRKSLLASKLGEAVNGGRIELVPAPVCQPEERVAEVLKRSNGLPVLVVGAEGDLRGILTPFDVL